MTKEELQKRLKFVKATPINDQTSFRSSSRRGDNLVENPDDLELSELDSFFEFEEDLAQMESARKQIEKIKLQKLNEEMEAEKAKEEAVILIEEVSETKIIEKSGDEDSFLVFSEEDVIQEEDSFEQDMLSQNQKEISAVQREVFFASEVDIIDAGSIEYLEKSEENSSLEDSFKSKNNQEEQGEDLNKEADDFERQEIIHPEVNTVEDKAQLSSPEEVKESGEPKRKVGRPKKMPPTPKIEYKRCEYIKKDGQRCKRQAPKHHSCCSVHRKHMGKSSFSTINKSRLGKQE